MSGFFVSVGENVFLLLFQEHKAKASPTGWLIGPVSFVGENVFLLLFQEHKAKASPTGWLIGLVSFVGENSFLQKFGRFSP